MAHFLKKHVLTISPSSTSFLSVGGKAIPRCHSNSPQLSDNIFSEILILLCYKTIFRGK